MLGFIFQHHGSHMAMLIWCNMQFHARHMGIQRPWIETLGPCIPQGPVTGASSIEKLDDREINHDSFISNTGRTHETSEWWLGKPMVSLKFLGIFWSEEWVRWYHPLFFMKGLTLPCSAREVPLPATLRVDPRTDIIYSVLITIPLAARVQRWRF